MKQLDLSAVHETFSLLRFACDEAGEQNYNNNWLWKVFLRFRDDLVGVKEPVPLPTVIKVFLINCNWNGIILLWDITRLRSK